MRNLMLASFRNQTKWLSILQRGFIKNIQIESVIDIVDFVCITYDDDDNNMEYWKKTPNSWLMFSHALIFTWWLTDSYKAYVGIYCQPGSWEACRRLVTRTEQATRATADIGRRWSGTRSSTDWSCTSNVRRTKRCPLLSDTAARSMQTARSCTQIAHVRTTSINCKFFIHKRYRGLN